MAEVLGRIHSNTSNTDDRGTNTKDCAGVRASARPSRSPHLRPPEVALRRGGPYLGT